MPLAGPAAREGRMYKQSFASALVLVGFLAATAPAAGAHDEHEAHNQLDTGAAALGEVHFPVTCSPEAQARFDRAMLLQHSFWYQQAAAAFRSVRESDPGCTMAYWGEAMTLLLNPFSEPSEANL